MFTTPPQRKMVKTRRGLMSEQQIGDAEDQKSDLRKIQSEKVMFPVVDVAPRPKEEGSKRSLTKVEKIVNSSKSDKTTSSRARRKKLELEYEATAAIQKKLAAELAAIGSSSSSRSKRSSIMTEDTQHKVENWLERSEMDQRYAHENPTPHTSSRADMHELAKALKDVITQASTEAKNQELLTRLSTSKDLPLFFGDPLEWLQFKEAYYESSRACNYSDVENLWRLRKCLRGEARDTVSSLLIGNTTPYDIMESLELRYGRPEIIINKITTQLKKLTPLSQNYHSEIVNFSIKIKNYVAAAKAIKQTDYLRSPELITAVISKCPTALITKWADYLYIYNESQKAKLDLFSDFLHEEAKKTAVAGVSYIHSHARTEYSRKHDRNMQVLNLENKSYKCKFCRISPHALIDCKRFKRALRKDRWRFIRDNHLCYKCISRRHDRHECEAPNCDVDGCGQAHHRLLHWSTGAPVVSDASVIKKCESGENHGQSSECETVNITLNPSCILLKIVRIKIHGPRGIITTHALLDDGATVSLMSASVADAAGIRGQTATMRVRGAFDNELLCNSEIINCKISDMDNNDFMLKSRKIKELNLPVQKLSNIDLKKYSHLNKINSSMFCSYNVKPNVLIGQDNYHLICPKETLMGRKNEPVATLTPLGWCIHGVVSTHSLVHRAETALTTLEQHDDFCTSYDAEQLEYKKLNDLVSHSFTFESIGVNAKPRVNSLEARATSILEGTSRLVNGSWEVGLPWKNDSPLPASYLRALGRLKLVEKKMANNPDFAIRYRERINYLFENNYAREVEDLDLEKRTWYLPHFGVDNPNKKKLRVVFDAAATSEGKSLNDFLLQGPDLLESLFGIMLRFREGSVGLMGDIKDMFLRIKIRKEDQDVFRFLWRNNSSEPVKKYVMTSLIFGANCSPFIAQFIKNKNAERFITEMPEAVHAILKSHYMDDYIDSVDDVTEAQKLIEQISYIHLQGGFQIRNFNSNRQEILNSRPEESLSENAIKFKIDSQERTLGLLWYPATDTLSFDLSLKKISKQILCGEIRPTKRETLRIVMSIYDIHGYLTPFTINIKIMLQSLWKINIKWDDRIDDNHNLIFIEWIKQLKNISSLQIPRSYFFHSDLKPEKDVNISIESKNITPAAKIKEIALELHIFCDASPSAYAAVAYWRRVKDNEINTSFIACKSRVAPLKPVSIPRLELQAAVIACRLAATIEREHRIKATTRFFWTDSSTVLCWIMNDTRQYNVFISNRLGEIDELSRKNEWNYISSKNNIADIATKINNYQLRPDCEWFRGPGFLREYFTTPKSSPETEKMKINENSLELINTVNYKNYNDLPVPDPIRFSSWLRLKRSMARILQFIEKCRRRNCDMNSQLLLKAEQILIKFSQMKSFPNEYQLLMKNKTIPKDSRLAHHHRPFSNCGMYLFGPLEITNGRRREKRKRWRIRQRLSDMFWTRWIKEVLPVLIPRKKWTEESAPVKKGDMVIVIDSSTPRNMWPKGIIQQVYPGRDRRIRVVDVQTAKGVLRRPVIKILPLHLDDECHDRDTGRENVVDTPSVKIK